MNRKALLIFAVFLPLTSALAADGSQPGQAEIMVRFVQVSATNLAELSLDNAWSEVLTNALPAGMVVGACSVVSTQRISFLANTGKFACDTLSAPKVTVRWGETGDVRAVREYVYATAGDIRTVVVTNGTNVSKGLFAVPIKFDTCREGVILTATPVYDAPSKAIHARIQAKLLSKVVWKEYEAVFYAPDGSRQTLKLPQPSSTVQAIDANLTIPDGGTVVLGGLTKREDPELIVDKIPFLGSIPLLGRLFRNSQIEQRETALIIFVTARGIKSSVEAPDKKKSANPTQLTCGAAVKRKE